MTDKTPGACQCHEKHAPTYWEGVVREYKDALEKAESRPLTPDAITDEMVERAQRKIQRRATRIPAETIRLALIAALTEPPARPEGVEAVEEILGSWGLSYVLGYTFTRDALDSLADHIAARVHVLGEEG